MIGKEALFVILGLKRFKDDEENLEKFVRTHVRRLLKMDMVAVLVELERQQEVLLALRVRPFVLFFVSLLNSNFYVMVRYLELKDYYSVVVEGRRTIMDGFFDF